MPAGNISKAIEHIEMKLGGLEDNLKLINLMLFN